MQRSCLTPWLNYDGTIRRPMPMPKSKAIEEWEQLQPNAKHTPLVLKPMLVRLTSSHLTNILGIFRWGVGSIPPHVLAKVKKDEDLHH